MVGVGEGGFQSALARVVMINWSGQIVLDQFVRPSEPVTDYRTFVSGICPNDLQQPGVVDLATCRIRVLELLKGKILIGHGLENDLVALGICHPWHLIRNTAIWEPFMKLRPCVPPPPPPQDHRYLAHPLVAHTPPHAPQEVWLPRKLKELCSEHLKREIQVLGKPHDPFEDALAALDLYKMVRNQWEEVMLGRLNESLDMTFEKADPHERRFQQQLRDLLQPNQAKQKQRGK